MLPNKNYDLGLLVLRLFFGGFMLTHGWGKAVKLFEGNLDKFADPIGIGAPASLILTVFAEVVCAILLVVGFKTRLASVPLMITMLVAAFIVHADDPFGKKEFALLYFAGYLAIFFMGAGKYSVDGQVSKA